MARLTLVPTLGALLIAAFAGCLEDTKTALEDQEAMPHTHAKEIPFEEFLAAMGSCEEGGFIAAYPLTAQNAKIANGSWTRTDISKEIGNPIRDSTGQPVRGPLYANVHMGYRCPSVTVNGVTQKDFQWGWIGNPIEPPAWDPGGADLHYVVSGLGFQNGTIADMFRVTNTAPISMSRQALVQWYVPRDAGSVGTPRQAAYVVYDDVQKGTYSSYSELMELRDVQARTVRLWWQVPTSGERGEFHAHDEVDSASAASPGHMDMGPPMWHPVYWDVKSGGATQYVTPQVDSPEVACHTNAGDAHGGLGAACQPTLTAVYEHKSLEFEQGKIFTDVTLDALWDH